MRNTPARRIPNLIRIPLCAAMLLLAGAGAAEVTADYSAFDDLLLKNVRDGFVDYDGFAADPRFETFVAGLETTDPASLDHSADRLAFYVNAYNALAIRGILDGGSPDGLFGRYGFFKRKKYIVAGETLNLFDLEHEKIISIGDPRIHFAIVCASLSCPRLSSRAYTPGDIDTQLFEAAKRFLNDPTRNRFDLERRVAFVSKIFEWYAADFEAASGSVQQYMARFIDDVRVKDALRLDEFELKYEEYDWGLNGNFSGGD